MTDASHTQMAADWRANIERLPLHRVPAPGLLWIEPGPNGREGVWTAVREAMLRFVDDWGAQAAALGWSTVQLFGVHRTRGAIRADSLGALVSLYPQTVLAIDATTITLGRRAARATYRGMTNEADSIPLWEFPGAIPDAGAAVVRGSVGACTFPLPSEASVPSETGSPPHR